MISGWSPDETVEWASCVNSSRHSCETAAGGIKNTYAVGHFWNSNLWTLELAKGPENIND